jgi:hypothetical protein
MKTAMTLGVLGLLTACGAASAGTIDQAGLALGVEHQFITVDGIGVEVCASPDGLARKGFGVGNARGSVNGEVDGDEYLAFTFSAPVFITGIELGHLFATGNAGDGVNEGASVWTDAGEASFVVTSGTTGSWTGPGGVSNLSPGLNGSSGRWAITGDSIFAAPVTQVVLRAGNGGELASLGDFSFVSMSFRAVPTPGALALLGLGGLIAGKRRR